MSTSPSSGPPIKNESENISNPWSLKENEIFTGAQQYSMVLAEDRKTFYLRDAYGQILMTSIPITLTSNRPTSGSRLLIDPKLFGLQIRQCSQGELQSCLEQLHIPPVQILEDGTSPRSSGYQAVVTSSINSILSSDWYDLLEVLTMWRTLLITFQIHKDRIKDDPNFRLYLIQRLKEFSENIVIDYLQESESS